MGNYNNIRAYSEFAHKVAPYGGPDQFVKEVASKTYAVGIEKGIQKTRVKEVGIGAIAFVAGIAIWEGGKCIIRKYNNYRQEIKDKDTKDNKVNEEYNVDKNRIEINIY